jgi:hypothetical protein
MIIMIVRVGLGVTVAVVGPGGVFRAGRSRPPELATEPPGIQLRADSESSWTPLSGSESLAT